MLRRVGSVVIALAAIFGVGVAAWGAYGVMQVNSSIAKTAARPVTTNVAGQTTTSAYRGPMAPTTFLLLGNDTRGGASTRYVDKKVSRSGQGGGGADAIILLRVDPVTQNAQMLSIHRDLRVEVPGHGLQKINSSLVLGKRDSSPDAPPDPWLAVQTVEALTGVKIDHVGIVDFAGFSGIVDAVGGVQLCLETGERDKWTGLNLPQGCTLANGEQALSYARSRKAYKLIDGKWKCDCTDDYGRMKRQQYFLKQLATQVASPSLLGSLPQLAEAMRGNVWVDPGLDVNGTIDLARRMAGSLDNVTTASLPVFDQTVDGVSYAVLNQEAATPILEAFRNGTLQSAEIKLAAPGEGAPPAQAVPTTKNPIAWAPGSGGSGSKSKSKAKSSDEDE